MVDNNHDEKQSNKTNGVTAEIISYTLEELLAGSTRDSLQLNDEDKQWLNAVPVGKEIISD